MAFKLRNMHVQGVCTHVSDVKPHIVVATYTDAETGYELYQQIPGVYAMHAVDAAHECHTCALQHL